MGTSGSLGSRDSGSRHGQSLGIAVIVCAPFLENVETMTRGHLHSFDDEFLASLGATNIRFVESAGWGQFLEPRYQMFIATLSGRA